MTGRRQGIYGPVTLSALMGLTMASMPVLGDDELITLVSPAAEATALALGAAAPVSDDVLGAESAKAAIQVDKIVINDQDLNGVVQDNIAMNTQSGNNSVSGAAFQDSTGFVTVIQNTGNNVLIQNSTIVNVALDP